MSINKLTSLRLSDRDLDFLVETAASDVRDKSNLKKIIRRDEDFRNTFIGDENVFRKIMADDEIFLKISPVLFFEILIRKAAIESDLSAIFWSLHENFQKAQKPLNFIAEYYLRTKRTMLFA